MTSSVLFSALAVLARSAVPPGLSVLARHIEEIFLKNNPHGDHDLHFSHHQDDGGLKVMIYCPNCGSEIAKELNRIQLVTAKLTTPAKLLEEMAHATNLVYQFFGTNVPPLCAEAKDLNIVREVLES